MIRDRRRVRRSESHPEFEHANRTFPSAAAFDDADMGAGNPIVFSTCSASAWNRDVGDGGPAYSCRMEARTLSLTVLGLSLFASVAVSCGETEDETAPLGTSRPPATEATLSTDPPSEVSTATPTTAVEVTVATEPTPDDPCLRRFREFEAAERVTDSPITVEINLVEGMYVVDTFQDASSSAGAARTCS